MKRYILFFLSLVTACVLGAQVTSQNYIRSRKMLNGTGTSYVDNIAYYDGLGRPFQTVTQSTQTGTVKERLATLQEYDAMGRETKMWLPTPVTADYVAAAGLKTTSQGSTGYSDTRPYNETVYEASPLDRVTKQYGAGAAWYSGHPVAMEYLTNTSTVGNVLSCKLYTTNGETLSGGTTYYNAQNLYVTKTTDEDGNIGYTFTDKQGRTVLERRINGTEQLDTYYVYDAKGNLCFVLQPMYQSEASTDKYAFQYKYDNFGNCIWKKLPGAGYVENVYDEYNRLVFSQDGNQRTSGKWTFYVYDKFNRLVQQGENTSKSVSSSGVYLQNYYDDYTAFRTALPSDELGQYPDDTSINAKGSLTGTIMNVFGSSEKIYTVYYYDIKGRVIKTIENNLMGGYNTTETTYTFSDQPATVTLTHTANGKLTQTEVYTYMYDHSDRISSVTHKLNSNTVVTLASYTYDDKGRMATKKLHGSSTNQVTYAYNIRSWLTGISSNKFTQTLGYGSHYNGNISSMNWTANGDSHSYTFTYDGINRMLSAVHGAGNYTEEVGGYDKNGNILILRRNGRTGADSYGRLDNLQIMLSGNQVTNVRDVSSVSAYDGGTDFVDGVTQTTEYTYDNNGNLTKDLNKGITNISYNSLSLPQVVTFSNGNTITYLYTADGRKLRTVHVINGTATTTDYCGNVIYENGTQKLLLTEEGYIDLANGNAYYYYLKDHQGNNRVVLSSSGTVMETNHYYPFGGVFSTSTNVQPYKYNGKELDSKNGLNWYDYGARHYDATLGRWHVVDPLGEKYYSTSPYAYCLNNPVGTIDFEGKLVIFINGFHNGFQGGKKTYWKTKYGQFDDAVMNHFGDDNRLYYDGSIGGITGIPANIVMKNRFEAGYIVGSKEASDIIANLAKDNNGNIIETVKIVTHSMGGAYGKGLVSALMEYIHQHPELSNGISIAEYDFAPFQSSFQKAVNGVDTYQYSHTFDRVAGNEPIEGAEIMDTKNANNAKHSINDFYEYIKNLPQGRYKIINGEVVKNE